MINEEERWQYIISLDEELLKGGVVLSEWCSFIVRETDLAFAKGAHLAAILTAVSGIETYLRSEYSTKDRMTFFELINDSLIDNELRNNLHKLRKYRNRWVHVNDPWEDQGLIENPEDTENELESMAYFASKVLRQTLYQNQCV